MTMLNFMINNSYSIPFKKHIQKSPYNIRKQDSEYYGVHIPHRQTYVHKNDSFDSTSQHFHLVYRSNTNLPNAIKFPSVNVIPNFTGLKKTSIDCLMNREKGLYQSLMAISKYTIKCYSTIHRNERAIQLRPNSSIHNNVLTMARSIYSHLTKQGIRSRVCFLAFLNKGIL